MFGAWREHPEEARGRHCATGKQAASAATTKTRTAMFHIVLVHPEIPPNTGNVIRLAANTGSTLHLIEPLGFSLDDKRLRRAGLDYHEFASVRVHTTWTSMCSTESPAADRMFAFTTRGNRLHATVDWRAGDWLVFGSETSGLPDSLLETFPPASRVRLPMRPGQRSLNLSNAAAVAVFEAWRCNDYRGGS
jgi:tRNA (cytidine/uridine-2'-O-)-methyltransferase